MGKTWKLVRKYPGAGQSGADRTAAQTNGTNVNEKLTLWASFKVHPKLVTVKN